MKVFDDYMEVIYEHEVGNSPNGGLVDDPDDPGLATKYGISLLFLKGIILVDADIDHDGDIDKDDIKLLSQPQSEVLYLKYFWNPLHFDELTSELLKLHIFDHCVNAGSKTAVRLLQNIVKATPDGVIGNQTITLANKQDVVNSYIQARKDYYLQLTVKNPKLVKFYKGWINRVNSTNF
jgi:lysozyme family protein